MRLRNDGCITIFAETAFFPTLHRNFEDLPLNLLREDMAVLLRFLP